MARERVRVAILPDEIINKNTGELNYGHTHYNSEAIREAGGLPAFIDVASGPEEVEETYDAYDAFFITGGLDVNTILYGARSLPTTKPGSIENDRMAIQLIKRALDPEDPKPFIAVCRGMQLFNVAMGGTLDQHLPASHREGMWDHRAEGHPVQLVDGTYIAELLGGAGITDVNSRHHQAVDRLGRGLKVAARAKDGTIEAVEYGLPHPYALGVQWHEEELEGRRRLFVPMIEAARRVKYGGLLLQEAA
jgi:putative glutamine amidotransferase